MIAKTPQPPYYAVIFTSVRTSIDDGYAAMSNRMMKLASEQEGFLGVESSCNDLSITVSYWTDLDAIKNWREQVDHTFARRLGREKWYQAFKTRIAIVERDSQFEK